MAEIFTKVEDLAEVREVLGLDSLDLPDEAIKRGSVLEAAEAVIKKKVPDWEDLDDDDLVFLRKALAHYVVFLIAPRLPILLAEVESDNKSLFQRARSLDLRRVAIEHYGWFKWALKKISTFSEDLQDDKLVEPVSPANDEITG